MSLLGIIGGFRKMIGATASDAGRSGAVPQPGAGEQNAMLRGDGSWVGVVPLVYKGSVAGTAVPASSTTAGDFHHINADGTSQSKDWLKDEIAVWNGASWDQWDSALLTLDKLGTVSDSARTKLDVLSSVAVREAVYGGAGRGVYFDGVNDRLFRDLTGVTGLNHDFTISMLVEVPSANPSVRYALAGLSDGATGTGVAHGFCPFFETDGSLVVHLYGSNTTNINIATVLNFVSVYGGQLVLIQLERDFVGATFKIYVDGREQSVTLSTQGSAPGWDNGSLATDALVFGTRNGSDQWFRGQSRGVWLHNRKLGAAGALREAILGGDPLDQFGGGIFYAGDYSSDTDGLFGTRVTASGNNDGVSDGSESKDDVLRAFASADNNTHYLLGTSVGPGTRRVRVEGYYLIKSGNSTVDGLRVSANINLAWHALGDDLTTVGAWTKFVVEGQTSDDAPITRIDIVMLDGANVTFTGAGTSGDDEIYLHDVKVTPVGLLLDLPFDEGAGVNVRDRTTNRLHGEFSGGPAWLFPNRSGQLAFDYDFDHSEISSSPATTKLIGLPANAGILSIEFDRKTAFDAGRTLDVGISGDGDRHVAGQAVDATGIVYVESLARGSQSSSGETQIYIQTNGSTTQGRVVVRVVIELRGA